MVSASELKKLKVSELRDELAKRALDTKGVKDDLIARLANAMEGEDAVAKQSSAAKGAVVPASVPSSGDADLLAAEDPLRTGDVIAQPTSTATNEPAPELPENAAPSAAAPLASAAVAAPLLTEAEKIKLRKERFGSQSAGKQAILAPLGHVDTKEEIERRKKRAERFGLPIPVFKAEEEAKKRARAERFGLPASKAGEVISVKSASTAGGDDAKKKARAARFGIVNNGTGAGSSKGALSEEEQKKRAERAKRFAPLLS